MLNLVLGAKEGERLTEGTLSTNYDQRAQLLEVARAGDPGAVRSFVDAYKTNVVHAHSRTLAISVSVAGLY